MRHLVQDVRYGFRVLLRARGFTLVAVATLALGIGTTTAIFSVLHALLLRPLPYGDADRLVTVWQDMRARGGPEREWATPGNVADWKRETATFANLAAVTGWQAALGGASEPEALLGEQVTHEYFDVLRVPPALGRTFRPEEDVPNAPRVAILSHALWQRRFGADPAAVGSTALLGGVPHEIVGVMPAGFVPAIVPDAEVWRPLRLNTATPARGAVFLRVVARLADGRTFREAETAAHALAGALERAHPEWNARVGIRLVTLRDVLVGDARPGLAVLMGAAAFVLLIACANVANLLLARASGRAREVAVRLALGATRARVASQLLVESGLLAALGGLAGLIVAFWGVDGLVALAPAGIARVTDVGLHPAAVAFAAGTTAATGLLFGTLPALHLSRRAAVQSLKEEGRTGTSRGRSVRRALVVGEIAIAVLLLAGGGLLMRTLLRLQGTDLGFRPENVIAGFVLPPQPKYPAAERLVTFYDALRERMRAIPGAEVVALASVVPFTGDSDTSFEIAGRPPTAPGDQEPVAWYRIVSPEYFAAMGIALLDGRHFDGREAAPAVIVNEALARRYWPGASALGNRIRFGADGPWFTVVGISGSVKRRGARGSADAEMYVPYWHMPERGTNVVIRAALPPDTLERAMRQALRDVDPDIPLSGVTTMARLVDDSNAQPQFFAALVAAFAMMALALAGVGIYGVTAYTVARRTREIGVRMALGAAERQVVGLVFREGVLMAAAGLAIGLGAALLVARSMQALLFEVGWADPLALGGAAALLLGVALASTLVPARRAARVDPVVALRTE